MYDLIVVGGGPAGLAAAWAAWEAGLRQILIVERDHTLGGILNQCIHSGFGLHYFGEELTGPEYAGRWCSKVAETGIEVRTDTMVLDITPDLTVHLAGPAAGYCALSARSIILATGCRERTRGAIGIPGTRPAGVLTAGTAQRYVNMEGYLPGRRVVILGSGDIGLIMARRMTLEGAHVLACLELMPYSGGLTRNLVQCLQDFDIPLMLSHTVVEVRGKQRVEQVVAAAVDENRRPIPGTEQVFDCDTLLLSVGLIPENELARQAGIPMDPRTGGALVYEDMQTEIPGIFTCGNAAHVHDLVDYVTAESLQAGRSAAAYVQKEGTDQLGKMLKVERDTGISYTLPQRIRPARVEKETALFFRVNRVYGPCTILVTSGTKTIARFSRSRMAPGEMERITIPKVLLTKADGTITISVQPEGEQLPREEKTR